ncbi:hypothetical protein PGRAN_07873 [Listeria grandensis FSL F6-0971]|uniref:Uncharacterized protein n=1 Tax=Listeria grandensis FSL F6-0971 TaxID=1265819 RepID=W7BK32_9LIST|nr:hypothetical protein [Listeria grandensis]EUJ23561.1 hypothetical protein PGRAN_07873 [Listeria grandensis FSL F6-0971]
MQVQEKQRRIVERLKTEWKFLLKLGDTNKAYYDIDHFESFQWLVSAELVHALFNDDMIVFEGLTKQGEKLRDALHFYMDGKTGMMPILLFDQKGFPVQVFITMEEAAEQLGMSKKKHPVLFGNGRGKHFWATTEIHYRVNMCAVQMQKKD